jgi:hypothetical protein
MENERDGRAIPPSAPIACPLQTASFSEPEIAPALQHDQSPDREATCERKKKLFKHAFCICSH